MLHDLRVQAAEIPLSLILKPQRKRHWHANLAAPVIKFLGKCHFFHLYVLRYDIANTY